MRRQSEWHLLDLRHSQQSFTNEILSEWRPEWSERLCPGEALKAMLQRQVTANRGPGGGRAWVGGSPCKQGAK